MGKILRVDLSSRKVREQELDARVGRTFLGGRGIGAKILFEELKPGIDPLGPENKLIFATGPITGTHVMGNSKHIVMAKSPLTGIWGEAHAAGYFGCELKYASYDALVVEGASSEPAYIWINDGQAEVRDARHVWGKTTGEALESIRSELGDDKIRVSCIGQGGENLVKYACIMNDYHHAAGRSGMGAVMGSKKLKAVAVRGPRRVQVADEQEFSRLAREFVKEWTNPNFDRNKWGAVFHDLGTSGDVVPINDSGRLPTMNFRRSTFEGAEKISGETMAKTIRKSRATCPSCPLACNPMVEAKEPYSVDPKYGGPEYETLAALGSFCMNDNLVAVAKANELCNKYSIDTMSTGASIAFAMECYEKGLITRDMADGMDLAWGNPDAVVEMVKKIAMREGLGDLLAEGVRIAAKKIGKGAEEFALHVKGMEPAFHEPRGKKGLALSYGVAQRGWCHLQSNHDDDFEDPNVGPEFGFVKPLDRLDTSRTKVEYIKRSEDFLTLQNSMLVCMHLYWLRSYVQPKDFHRLINAVTGWNASPEELLKDGERIFNLVRAFNVREGVRRKDDYIPKRLQEPITDGIYKGQALPRDVLDRMLDDYYEMRGWDKETGIPTETKLIELGLDSAAGELRELGLTK